MERLNSEWLFVIHSYQLLTAELKETVQMSRSKNILNH